MIMLRREADKVFEIDIPSDEELEGQIITHAIFISVPWYFVTKP